MSDRLRRLLALAACAAVLAIVNLSIAGKERQIRHGTLVLLELAPVDPRSLMQGDYMALAYRIGEQARRQLRARGEAHDGHVVVMLDERRVARFVRLHEGGKLQPGEILLRYRLRGDSMKFATNAFFFQEGQAKRYETARYGEFRVAPDGELLLQALRGADGERL